MWSKELHCSSTNTSTGRILSLSTSHEHAERNRVLYIVTSMNEFDNGRRETQKDYNRFSNIIVPLLVEATSSMIETGYQVDVYLIAHYNVTESRKEELQSALPVSVGLQVWGEATPIGYSHEHSKTEVQEITRGLARQHRFMIKDKLLFYDIFVNFEDDLLIKGAHVQHFVNLTNELFRLRQDAPEETNNLSPRDAREMFYGAMTQAQLQRVMPGFMRVEAAIRNFQPHQENLYAQIPMDYDWNATHRDLHLDATVCCHISEATVNDQRPRAPSKDDLYFWETSIDALGVRKLPDAAAWDWVLLQAGNKGLSPKASSVVGDYWSGLDHGYFGSEP